MVFGKYQHLAKHSPNEIIVCGGIWVDMGSRWAGEEIVKMSTIRVIGSILF